MLMRSHAAKNSVVLCKPLIQKQSHSQTTREAKHHGRDRYYFVIEEWWKFSNMAFSNICVA